MLDLPSGQLTIETANSSHIHPDEDPDEPGAIIPVPPGRYVVTLYRLKWSDMTEEVRERVGKAGVGEEFIVLTPFAQAEKPPKTWPLGLPFPVGKNTVPVGKYTVAGPVFTGQIWFWDFWEIFWLNLDPKAAAGLGIGFGSVLDIETGGRRFTAVYLNQAIKFSIPHVQGYKAVGRARADAGRRRRRPELALGRVPAAPERQEWTCWPACASRQRKRCRSRGMRNGKKLTATVRPERLLEGTRRQRRKLDEEEQRAARRGSVRPTDRFCRWPSTRLPSRRSADDVLGDRLLHKIFRRFALRIAPDSARRHA